MKLTSEERERGRSFRQEARERLAELNRSDPMAVDVPPFIAAFRHECEGRGGRSTSMELKEAYWPEDHDPPTFAFVFREGRCRHCPLTARSSIGRVVVRGPIAGRRARAET